MNTPSVSVVISTVGRPFFLGSLLQAISTHLSSVIEIIVINNNRHLDSNLFDKAMSEHLAEFAGSTRLLTGTCQTGGLSAARNMGASLATGEYLYFLDDECQLTRQNDSALIESTERNRDVVFGGYRDFPLEGWEIPLDSAAETTLVAGPHSLGAVKYMSGGNLLIHREIFVDAGGFNELLGRGSGHIELGEDSELAVRLILRGTVIHFSPELVVYHATRSDKSSLRWRIRESYERGKASAALRSFLSQVPDDVRGLDDDTGKIGLTRVTLVARNALKPRLLCFPATLAGFIKLKTNQYVGS